MIMVLGPGNGHACLTLTFRASSAPAHPWVVSLPEVRRQEQFSLSGFLRLLITSLPYSAVQTGPSQLGIHLQFPATRLAAPRCCLGLRAKVTAECWEQKQGRLRGLSTVLSPAPRSQVDLRFFLSRWLRQKPVPRFKMFRMPALKARPLSGHAHRDCVKRGLCTDDPNNPEVGPAVPWHVPSQPAG